MIIDSFDNQTEPIISPSAFFGDQQNYCDIAIATFSREIYPEVLKLFPNEKIGEIKAANHVKTIHLLDVSGLKIAFYLSEIGSALASTDVIEINWKTGAKHFIYFGFIYTFTKSLLLFSRSFTIPIGFTILPSGSYTKQINCLQSG